MKTRTPLPLGHAALLVAAMLNTATPGLAVLHIVGRPDTGSSLAEPSRQGQGNGSENSANTGQSGQEPQSRARSEPAERVTLLAGATISVRIADVVDSSRGHAGDLYTGTVDPSVLVRDQVVIPRGTEAHVRMMEDKKGGHLHGKAKVALELVSLWSAW